MKQEMIQDLTSKIPDPFPPTRNAYTKRIMEILNNIKKLDVDTKKVIIETRSLQKEITLLTGKVQRSFSVAEDAVFSCAKQRTDEFSKRSYKLLAQVHDETNKLSEGIESCGVNRRDVIGLEEAVRKQQTDDIVSKLHKIQADILQVRQSNQSLMQQLPE
jgi:Cu/Ag efflux protein CusF